MNSTSGGAATSAMSAEMLNLSSATYNFLQSGVLCHLQKIVGGAFQDQTDLSCTELARRQTTATRLTSNGQLVEKNEILEKEVEIKRRKMIQRYKMTAIKWPFWGEIEKSLKLEIHVLEPHRSLQETDVL